MKNLCKGEIEMENIKHLSPETIEKCFAYLDNLRESGITNMFGASIYLEKSFGYNMKTSHNILIAWFETYTDRHSKKER